METRKDREVFPMIDMTVIKQSDPQLYAAMDAELKRQQNNIELIATGSNSFRKWSKYYLLHKNLLIKKRKLFDSFRTFACIII